MLSDFKDLVSVLYTEWKDRLIQSLHPAESTYFESICLKTAEPSDLKRSLQKLSYFLARKYAQKVIVLIDEYEALNNRAYDCKFFPTVRSPIPLLR
jgi:hypothetical protein